MCVSCPPFPPQVNGGERGQQIFTAACVLYTPTHFHTSLYLATRCMKLAFLQDWLIWKANTNKQTQTHSDKNKSITKMKMRNYQSMFPQPALVLVFNSILENTSIYFIFVFFFNFFKRKQTLQYPPSNNCYKQIICISFTFHLQKLAI